MKKFVSILLAVVLIFSVLTCVGCEADKKEKNTITYYHYEPYVCLLYTSDAADE